MDQLKVFLRQAVKYRFWIAFGISLLLPIIGYFVGGSTINAETTKREGEIKNAQTEVSKYTSGTVVNHQYQPEAAKKKEALVEDVDATWRRLFATQEPLLKWPPEVQDRFRKWGRNFPTEVDRNQVQSTLIEYAVAYPEFVEKIYKVFKPFNFEDGTGIIVAPDSKTLLAPATFSQDSPPDLTKIWAEQERLWVVTALLDALARINDSVGAQTWDNAVVKQINLLEVGAGTDQDQKSIAKGEQLAAPDPIVDPAAPAAPAPATPAPGTMSVGASTNTKEVMYLKTDSRQFKELPIKLTVLVDQAKLADYLVGLENSPMAIVVNEVEIAKPLTPVSKPIAGEKNPADMGGMGVGMRGGDEPAAPSSNRAAMSRGGMNRPMPGYPGAGGGEMAMSPSAVGGAGGAPKASGGVDNRGKNDAKARQDRLKKDKDRDAAKAEAKKIDQYYNVIEVTVYGRARFYLAPPPTPQSAASTASTPPAATPTPAPAPEAPKPEPAPGQPAASDAAKKDEAPKAEPAEPKAEAPKAEAPKADAPKPDAPAPKP